MRRESLDNQEARTLDSVYELIETQDVTIARDSPRANKSRLKSMNHIVFTERDRNSLQFLNDWKKKEQFKDERVKRIKNYHKQAKISNLKREETKKQIVMRIIIYFFHCVCISYICFVVFCFLFF